MTPRGRDMAPGALVANAASVSLLRPHDQERIGPAAPYAPEFRPPGAAKHEGAPGSFAHVRLKVGDQTQQGAQFTVLLKALEASGGVCDEAVHAQAVRDHFGYGGTYVGLSDVSTDGTD